VPITGYYAVQLTTAHGYITYIGP